jgi:hypothetical protein
MVAKTGKISVIGAGMAGLLAGSMLRNDCSSIIEAKEGLPNNHSAVLRFRSSIVGDTVGIPFKKVQAIKAVERWSNPIADTLSYSMKTNGSYTIRSSVTADAKISERYIAPEDFINRLAETVQGKFLFGVEFDFHRRCRESDPVISTIPMPYLMKALEWEEKPPNFQYQRGINITAKIIGCDAYCSLYCPGYYFPGSRISITGDNLVVECYPKTGTEAQNIKDRMGSIALEALQKLGIHRDHILDIKCQDQLYAKILPIDDRIRHRFIMWASDEKKVYSLGRFATWRPTLLLDDIVNDVRQIQRLIGNPESVYKHKKKG